MGRYADAGRWLHCKKNEDIFYAHIFSHHTVFEGVPAKQTLVIDIDQKVRTETALEEKTAELENVLGSITDAFYTVDSKGNMWSTSKNRMISSARSPGYNRIRRARRWLIY